MINVEKGGRYQPQKQRNPIDIVFDGIVDSEKNYEVAKKAGVTITEQGELRRQVLQILKALVSNYGEFSIFARDLNARADERGYIEELGEDIGNKEEKMGKLDALIDEKGKQLRQLQKENNKVSEDFKSLKEQQKRIDSKNASLKKQLTKFDMTVDDYLRLDLHVRSLQSKKKELGAEIDKKNGELSPLKADVGDLETKNVSLREEKKELLATSRRLHTNIREGRKDYAGLSDDLATIHFELSNTKNSKNMLEKEVGKLEKRKRELDEYERKSYAIIDKECKDNLTSRQIETDQNAKEYEKRAFDDANKKIDKRKKEITDLEEDISDKNEEKLDLIKKIAILNKGYDSDAEEFNNKIKSLDLQTKASQGMYDQLMRQLNMQMSRPEAKSDRLLYFYRYLSQLTNEDIRLLGNDIKDMKKNDPNWGKLWAISVGFLLHAGAGVLSLLK